MSDASISIEVFLAEQSSEKYTATVEATDDPGFVKVTPFTIGGGCLCSTALIVPKALIESVIPTGDKHPCCGKLLRVVEVKFKDGASLPISELFKQRRHLGPSQSQPFESSHPHSEWVQEQHLPPSHFGGRNRPSIVCPFGYQACFGQCGSRCYNPSRGESCLGGQVCPFGYKQCGCECYNPSRGETCHQGMVYHHEVPFP